MHNNSPWIKKVNLNSIALLLASLRVKKFLTVSDAIKNEYIFSRFISKKIENIGNPVSVYDVISKIPKNIEKKYDICFVGRLTKAKNPIKFIDIISNIKKNIPYINVIMLGDGELREECEKKIYRNKLQNNIELKGFVDNPYTYMAQSKVFCLTSDWEGYGLVVFEALALGLPCIVSNVGGLVDLVDEQCGVLCDTENDYISSINSILSNDNYKKMELNAKNRARKLDNKERYMNRIKELYGKTE